MRDPGATSSETIRYDPVRFIGAPIEAQFDDPPTLAKRPGCPQRFVWNGETVLIEERIAEWNDFERKGAMAHNIREEHAATAASRGSWGVGRFYFRVRTGAGEIFDIYYDRAPRNAGDRMGSWHLYRQLEPVEAGR